jgi:hypothetical protein
VSGKKIPLSFFGCYLPGKQNGSGVQYLKSEILVKVRNFIFFLKCLAICDGQTKDRLCLLACPPEMHGNTSGDALRKFKKKKKKFKGKEEGQVGWGGVSSTT